MKTISDFINKSLEYDAQKADFTSVPLHDVRFDQADILVPFQGTRVRLGFGGLAYSQMCEKLNVPHSYLVRCPAKLVDDNLNFWAMRDTRKVLVRSFNNGARAVLSDDYPPLMNSDVLKAAGELLEGVTHTTTLHSYLDSDLMDVKVQIKDMLGGLYAIGVRLVNGEVGNRLLRIDPFIQRHSCTNSIVYTGAGFVLRHFKVGLALIKGFMKDAIGKALRSSPELVQKVTEAEMDKIPSITKVIDQICKDWNIPNYTRDYVQFGTEREATRMGICNGLSWAAHQVDDHEQAIRLEELAGAMLMDPSSVFHKRVREGAEV